MKIQRIDFEPMCGESISRYAERAVSYLAERQERIEDIELYLMGDFNGIKIITTRYSTIDSIALDYHIQQEILAEEYKQTDKYKREQVKREQVKREKELNELNTKAKYMMKSFDKLDKSNKLRLINWLEDFQPISDHIGIKFDKGHIISELNKAGYIAGMNCKETGCVIGTTDEYADWLIGQCIDGLERIGAIHQVIHKFADEYRSMVL